MESRSLAKTYRIFFHEGEEFPAIIQVAGAKAWIDDSGFHIAGKERALDIPLNEIISAELYRRGGSMSVIRLRHAGGCIHLAVVRFTIGGAFGIANMLASRELCSRLAGLCLPSRQMGG